jgi:hypothetical protein
VVEKICAFYGIDFSKGEQILSIVENKIGKKGGAKDKKYISQSQKRETIYEKYRKSSAKTFSLSRKIR